MGGLVLDKTKRPKNLLKYTPRVANPLRHSDNSSIYSYRQIPNLNSDFLVPEVSYVKSHSNNYFLHLPDSTEDVSRILNQQETLASFNPGDPNPHRLLALVHQRQGNNKNAIAHYRLAKELQWYNNLEHSKRVNVMHPASQSFGVWFHPDMLIQGRGGITNCQTVSENNCGYQIKQNTLNQIAKILKSYIASYFLRIHIGRTNLDTIDSTLYRTAACIALMVSPAVAEAQNFVTGTVNSVPTETALKSKITFTDRNTLKDYVAVSDEFTGEYKLLLPTGEYDQKIEADNHFLYVYGPRIGDITGIINITKDTIINNSMLNNNDVPITSPYYGNILQEIKDINVSSSNYFWAKANRPIKVFPRFPDPNDSNSMNVNDSLDFVEAIQQIESKSNNKIQFEIVSSHTDTGINFIHVPNGTPPMNGSLGWTIAEEYFPDISPTARGPPKRYLCYINKDANVPRRTYLRELMRTLNTSNYANDPDFIMGNPSSAQNLHSDEGKVLEIKATLPFDYPIKLFQDSISSTVSYPSLPSSSVVTPVNNATNVSLDMLANWSLNNSYWFDLKFDDNSDFSSPIITETLTDTVKNITGLNSNTNYYMSITPWNGVGKGIEQIITFKTAPLVPSLNAIIVPSTGASSVSFPVRVVYSSSSNSTQYNLEISSDNSFVTLVKDTILFTTQADLSLSPHSKYFVRVRGENVGQGTVGSWSSTSDFTTLNNLPATPVVNTPSNGQVLNAANYLNGNLLLKYTTTNKDVDLDNVVTTFTVVGSNVSKSFTSTAAGQVVQSIDSLLFQPNETYNTTIKASDGISDVAGLSTTFKIPALVPSVNTITVPSVGASNISLPVHVEYSPSVNSTQYNLEISSDNTFATLVKDTILYTMQADLSLSPHTKYFARVRGENPGQGTVGVWSSTSDFTTLNNLPTAPVTNVPSNGQVLNAANYLNGNLLLKYTTTAKDSDNDNVTTTFVVSGPGVSKTFTSTANGQVIQSIDSLLFQPNETYNTTIKASDGISDVAGLSTTFKIPALVPSVNSITTPINGASSVSFPVRVVYSSSSNSTQYNLEISSDNSFVTLVKDTILFTTQADLSLSPHSKYFVRVRGENVGQGTVGSWSSTSDFTTLNNLPATPVVNTPSDNSVLTSLDYLNGNLLLKYTTTAKDSDNDTVTTTFVVSGPGVSKTFTSTANGQVVQSIDSLLFQPNQTYTTTIKSSDGIDETAGVSTTFTIPALVPSLNSIIVPSIGAVSVSLPVHVEYSPSLNSTQYNLEISPDNVFTTLIKDTILFTAQADLSLSPHTKYFARVRGENVGQGTVGSWSSTSDFTTLNNLPATPVVNTPSNGSVLSSVNYLNGNLLLKYTTTNKDVDNDNVVTTFTVVGSNVNRSFTSTAAGQVTQSIDSLLFQPNETYTTTIKSSDGIGETVGVSTTFKIPALVPSVNSITTPINGASNISLPVRVVYSSSSNSTQYNLEISPDNAFTILIKDTILFTTQADLSLSPHSKYFVRVRGENPGQGTVGEWSDIISFTTINNLPTSPVIDSPVNGQVLNAGNFSAGQLILKYTTSAQDADNDPVTTTFTVTGPGVSKTFTSAIGGQLTQTIDSLLFQPNQAYTASVTANDNFGGVTNGISTTFTVAPLVPGTTSIVVPVTGETGINTPVHVAYTSSINASQYNLEISLSDAFSALVKDTFLTDIQADIPLNRHTNYFARVRGENPGQGTVGPWSDTVTFSTLNTLPAVPVFDSPENNMVLNVDNYSDGQLILKYSSVAKDADNDDVTTTLSITGPGVNKTFTSTTNGQIVQLVDSLLIQPNATYTASIKASDGIGEVSGSNTSFTTAPLIPGATISILPASGSVNVAVPAHISFSISENATQYNLEISLENSFASLVKDTILYTTGADIVLQAHTKYFSRVRGENPGQGTLGNWSGIFDFTTINNLPTSPVIDSPVNGQVLNAGNFSAGQLILKYTTSAQDADNDPVTTTFTVTGPGVSKTFTSAIGGQLTQTIDSLLFQPNQAYTASVTANDNFGGVTNGISTTFTVAPLVPGTTSIVVPVTGETGINTPVHVAYTSSINASQYNLEISLSDAFSVLVKDTILTDIQADIPLNRHTNYFARVRGENPAQGTSGNWSATVGFTTLNNLPVAPVTDTPIDGQVLTAANYSAGNLILKYTTTSKDSDNDDVTTTFSVTGPGVNKTFTSTSNGQVTQAIDSLLFQSNQTYTAAIKASDGIGEVEGVSTTFKTPALAMPGETSIISPVNNSIKIASLVQYTLTPATNASLYELIIATDAAFTNIVKDTIVDTVTTLIPLANGTTYYTKVSGRNNNGNGPWTGVITYTTIKKAPENTVITNPLDNATEIVQPITFASTSANNAETFEYILYHANDNVLLDTTLTSNAFVYNKLATNRLFKIKARARNSDLDGSWSPVITFETYNNAPGVFEIVSPENNSIIIYTDKKLGITSTPSTDMDNDVLTKKYQIIGSGLDTIIYGNNTETIYLDSSILKLDNQYLITAEVCDGRKAAQATNTITFTTPKATGTGTENISSAKFLCYPNPVSDILNIEAEFEGSTVLITEIYSLDGRLLDNHIENVSGQYQMQIDFSSYKPNSYIIVFQYFSKNKSGKSEIKVVVE